MENQTETPNITVLTGHNSPETAYVVDDYPYGFRLRCRIRYWLEYKKGHGFRLVSQTTNPKKPGDPWNKPKASVYCPLAVMFLDLNGHVTHMDIGLYDLENLETFATTYAAALQSEPHQRELRYLRAVQKRREAYAEDRAAIASQQTP